MSPYSVEPVARLVLGAVLEDAVDQLAIVSATFGPVPAPHVNSRPRTLEDILLKETEEDRAGPGGDIRQLHSETAYIQKVMEMSITALYKGGNVQPLEDSLEAYRGRHGEKEDIILREHLVKEEISTLTRELEELRASEVEMRKKEMRKIAELKDSYLDCRRRAGSEESYVAKQEEVRERERRADLRDMETVLRGRIRKLETDIEHEERVTAEVERPEGPAPGAVLQDGRVDRQVRRGHPEQEGRAGECPAGQGGRPDTAAGEDQGVQGGGAVRGQGQGREGEGSAGLGAGGEEGGGSGEAAGLVERDHGEALPGTVQEEQDTQGKAHEDSEE